MKDRLFKENIGLKPIQSGPVSNYYDVLVVSK